MCMSAAPKPSLTGVRIKARKGAVKAHAKHEPAVFRDQLYKHLETVPDGDFEGVTNKLVQAGSTLEFLKYADALFEILLIGGLLQPGGSYLDDGAPPSPFSITLAKEATVEEMKKYVDVLNKLIRRYKYLQKPLEETSLPRVLQWMNKWPADQRDKFSLATGLMMAQGLASTSPLQESMTKDHLVKDGTALASITLIFRAYLADQSVDHLVSALKRGGVRDLSLFFPLSKRQPNQYDAHFREAGMPALADWMAKKQSAAARDAMSTLLRTAMENGDSAQDVVAAIRSAQEESAIPDAELVHTLWTGLMSSVDWSARPDQIETLALREVTKFADIIAPFCTSAKTEVALINTLQIYCYEDTKVMKAFPQLLKVLYNKDCVSDKAIIYWWQKGAKTQGKQHFLKVTEALVKFLEDQDSDEEEE